MSNRPDGEPSDGDEPSGEPWKGDSRNEGQPFTQEIQHNPVSARVPEGIGRGVFCTAAMVMHTPQEFVLDFMSTLVQPYQIVARVVITPLTFSRLINAMRENLARYKKQFDKPSGPSAASTGSSAAGPAVSPQAQSPTVKSPSRESPAAPSSPTGVTSDSGSIDVSTGGVTPTSPSGAAPPQPNISELYEQLRLPDEMLGGNYANVAMIRHTAEEFAIDFIANFYPRSAVTARVFFSAARIPTLIDTFANAFEKYEQKIKRPPEAPPDQPDV